MKLHRDIGLTQKTAWHLAHRIRETWQGHQVEFTGPVDVDEPYIGGKDYIDSLGRDDLRGIEIDILKQIRLLESTKDACVR